MPNSWLATKRITRLRGNTLKLQKEKKKMINMVKRCGWLTMVVLCSFLIVTASSHAAAITATLDFSTLKMTLYTLPLSSTKVEQVSIPCGYLEVSAENDNDEDYAQTYFESSVDAEVDGAKANFILATSLSVEISPDNNSSYYYASGWADTYLTSVSTGLLEVTIDYTWEIDTSSLSEADGYAIDFYLAAWIDSTNTSVDNWVGIDNSTVATSGTGTLYLYLQTDGSSDVWIGGGVSADATMAPAPVPSSFVLFFAGISGLAVLHRRNFV